MIEKRNTSKAPSLQEEYNFFQDICEYSQKETIANMRIRFRKAHLIAMGPILLLLVFFLCMNFFMIGTYHAEKIPGLVAFAPTSLRSTSTFSLSNESSGDKITETGTGVLTSDKLLPALKETVDRGENEAGRRGSYRSLASKISKLDEQQHDLGELMNKRSNPNAESGNAVLVDAAFLDSKLLNIRPPTATSSFSQNATFSACLLIKDDNAILNEWIAYHYFVLNMRTLIVAIDPTSKESPSTIFDKWRQMTDLEILEWNDADFMPIYFKKTGKPPAEFLLSRNNFSFPVNISFPLTDAAILDISKHRYRQRVFLAQCMRKLRNMGQSWMIHIDTDEFIVASKLLRQMKPDYVDLRPIDEPGSVLNLIQQVASNTPDLVNYPCMSILRVLFGSAESSPTDLEEDVPDGFAPSRFETLRWRFHALPHDMKLHGYPKVLLDLSAISEKYFPKELVFSIHRPIPKYCKRNKDATFTTFRKQPIAANHYLGSWERYSGREDSRRSRHVYEERAKQRRGKDDGIRKWLKGFVKTLGRKTSAQLLGREYIQSNYVELV